MSHFTVAVITKTKDPKEMEKLLAPFQENNMDDCPKEYLEFFEDEECEVDDETGKKGYWENPNRKWDWYQVGGRWKELLKLKDGSFADQAKVSDLDLSIDEESYNHASRFWEVVVENSPISPLENPEDFFNLYKREYYIDQFGSKEVYALNYATFQTFAVITPEGKWFEKGEMGWRGVDSSTNESRKEYKQIFNEVLEANSNSFITVVDCHI